MSEFTTGDVEGFDDARIEREMDEALEARFEGWSPAKGGAFSFMKKAFARVGALLYGQLGLTLVAMFKRFGESLIGVPPILAAPASGESVWTMIDNAGYTIPAGTQVTIAATGDRHVGFRTLEEVVVAPGFTTASVPLVAIEAGVQGNNLTADPVLRDALIFVEPIALDGETSNGADEETEDAYLIRLVRTLRTLSLSLIVGRDFAIDALGMAPVARALCIEAYDSDAGKEAALHVTVYTRDASGAALSAPNKAALVARQQAKVPSGVKVHAADGTYTAVKVKTSVAARPGFDPAAVKAAVEARLAEYLARQNWGVPQQGDPGSSGGWENKDTVYRNELIAEEDRVSGVERVVTLELAKAGDALGTTDVKLPGKAPVAEPGTIEVSVV